MLRVMQMHRDAVEEIDDAGPAYLKDAAAQVCGTRCLQQGRKYGFRNAQATVLAPTGTISFMMDCDTTGIEPDIALVKYKQLAGGGMLKIVNQTVPLALKTLGYDDAADRSRSCKYIDENDTIEGAPRSAGRALAGLRLCVQAGQRRAQHRLAGPRADDGRRSAVPVRCDLQDGQHAHRCRRREDIAEAYRWGWELGLKALGHLPRRFQAEPAAFDTQSEATKRAAKPKAAANDRGANGCPTRGSR